MVYDRVFIFIDESGDPGNILKNGASSKHYAELALQLNGDILSDFIAHIISWKYVLGKPYETKALPKGSQCKRYLAPILELHHQGKLKWLKRQSLREPSDRLSSCILVELSLYPQSRLGGGKTSYGNSIWRTAYRIQPQLMEELY